MSGVYSTGVERLIAIAQELSRARDVASVQAVARRAERELTGADGAPFAEEEVRLLQALANVASVALENVERSRELEAQVIERSAELEVARRAEEALRHELEERKRAEAVLSRVEAQLRQMQRMDAVGQLARGIAHDFNNLLSVILSFSEMAQEQLKAGDPLLEDLQEITRAGERASELTKRLLGFSRQQPFAPRIVDIGEVVRGMEPGLQRLLGERVELEVSAEEDLFPILSDTGHIEQVVMNLAVNARDAMPGGGKLVIEAANVHLSGEYTSVHLGVADGDYVIVAVSDTGSGMDRETQARIFEPFFTTKDKGKGKGKGLGLSTVYGIVKQNQGHVWVYSEPGEGTTFKVYLPRAAADVRPSLSRPPVLARFSGSETILLVEGDEQVRKGARGILRRNGYEVIEVASAGDALLFAEDRERHVDLLLTDAIMPEMGVMQLVESLTATRPEMRVICMSAHSGDAAVRQGIIESGIPFVQKPLAPETLLMAVRAELDRIPQSGTREKAPSAPRTDTLRASGG